MDDINATINSILGDPQKMEQLRAVAQSLGMNPGNAPPAGDPPAQGNASGGGGGGFDPSILASIMKNFQAAGQQSNAGGNMNSQNNGPQAQPNTTNASGGSAGQQQGGGFNLGSFAKIADVFSAYNTNDKNTDLLRALKPHFSDARAGRIDDAVRIMQILRAWPALRDSGLLGSLGNIFSGGGNR